MSRVGIAVAIALVFGSALAVEAWSAKGGGRAAAFACPRVLSWKLLPPPDTPEAVLQAARKQIPSKFHGRFRNQQGMITLTRRHYVITSTVAFGEGGPSLVDRARLYGYAKQKCGQKVADASWAVLFQVPEASRYTPDVAAAYLARTKSGWRLWYPLILKS
jgi:hypothetical protein